MKSIKQLSFIGLAIMLVLNSCTMEKRVYMSGYHIRWNKSKHNPDKQELVKNDNSKQTVEQSESETNSVDDSYTPTELDNNLTASVDNSVIIPTRKFSKMENTITTKTTSISEKKIISKKESRKNKTTNKKSATAGGGKSQLVALLLCIFIGALGIHRFYLGYIGIGVIQLLTLGGCGVWAIIDLIMIITGDLKPKSGDYGTKL
jgi:hypothetical protein